MRVHYRLFFCVFAAGLTCSAQQTDADAVRIGIGNIHSVEYPFNPSAACNTYPVAGCFNATQFEDDMIAIGTAGFNAVWMPTFWAQFQPQVNPTIYNDQAFSNLDQMLSILELHGMSAVISPEYGIGGMFPENYNELLWLVDDTEWGMFKDYVTYYVQRTAVHQNVVYMFFTESTEPNMWWTANVATLNADPMDNNPLLALPHSFDRWLAANNPAGAFDITYWNTRWGTNFPDVMHAVPCSQIAGCPWNQYFDYVRWGASLVLARFTELPAIVHANHPGALVGYHDYDLVNLNYVGEEVAQPSSDNARYLPLLPQNDYDFYSFVFYGPWTTPAQVKKDLQQRINNFAFYWGKQPMLLGETGFLTDTTLTAQQQADFLNAVMDFNKANGIGYNYWGWQGAPGDNSVLNVLDGQGQPTTVYQVLKLCNLEVPAQNSFTQNDFAGNGLSGALLFDPSIGQSYTALSNGNGTYQYVPNLFTPGFDTLRTGDYNGDGRADLILYNSHTALAYIGFGKDDGTFAFQSLFWGPNYDTVETGDINGDGKTDVALYTSSTGSLYTGISNGDGTFTYQYHLVSQGFTFVKLADFTGDGKADLLLYNATNGLAFLGIGDGAGGFAFQPLSISPGYNLADAGDLNGDGKADVILYNGANGNAATGISNGGGFTFTPLVFSPGFTSVKLADYTGDGKADVTVYDKNTPAAYFGTGNGDGTFNFQSLFWNPGYDYVVPEDVNGDGKMDVVLYNSVTGTEYTGISNGDGTFNYTYWYWGIGNILAR